MSTVGMTWAEYKKHRDRGEYDNFERELGSLSVVDKDPTTQQRYQQYVQGVMAPDYQDDIIRNKLLEPYYEMLRREEEERRRREEEWRKQNLTPKAFNVEDGQSMQNFSPEAARAKAEPRIRAEQAYKDWNKTQEQDPEYAKLSAEDRYNMFAKEYNRQIKEADYSQDYKAWLQNMRKDPTFDRMSDEEQHRQYMHYLDQTAKDNGTLPEAQRAELSEYKYKGLTDKERNLIDAFMRIEGEEFEEYSNGGTPGSLYNDPTGKGAYAQNKYKEDAAAAESRKAAREKTIEDIRNELKHLGWDDKKIDTELSRYKELEDWRITEAGRQRMADIANDPNLTGFEKAMVGVGNTAADIISAPFKNVEPMGSFFSDSAYGRNTSSKHSYLNSMLQEGTEQTRNMIGDDHPVLQTAYDIGVSAGESTTTMLLAGSLGLGKAGEALSLVPFFTSAYDSGYKDAVNRGFSEGQAQGYGFALGSIEALTEIVSLDKLWKMADGKKVGRNLFINALAQMGIEGSEEVASEFGQAFADYVAVKVGGTGKTQRELDIEDFMSQGMNAEEAAAAASKKFAEQVGLAFISGAGSALPHAAIATTIGSYRSKYGDNLNKAISDRYQSLEIKGDTAYEQQLAEEKNRYENNPTQYIADNYKVQDEEDARVKQALEEIAEKERSGKKLSVSDKSFITENVLANEDQFNQEYLDKLYDQGEESDVPYEYRTVKSKVTEDEARVKLAEAAKAGDADAFVDAMNQVSNAADENLRSKAGEIIEEYVGMAQSHGITQEAIGQAQLSRAQAYKAGLEGRELEGRLSNDNQIAYNEGKKAYIETKTKTIIPSVDAVQNATIGTKEGNMVKLAGLFDEEGIKMADGGSVKVNDLDFSSESAVVKAYKYADDYESINVKNAFLSNLKDDQNIDDYNRDFGKIYDSALAGLTLNNVKKEFTALDEGTVENIYKIGEAERKERAVYFFAEAFSGGKGDTKGEFINTSSSQDARMIRLGSMVARALHQDIEVVDDFLDKEGNVTNAHGVFLKEQGKIIVRADDFIRSLEHEVGHYIETYNKSDYDSLRNAVANFAVSKVGADTFVDEFMGRYQGNYSRQNLKADEISGEMFNDIVPIILNSKQGADAFADYLAKNYGAEEARSLGQQIKDYILGLVDAIKGLFENTIHPTAYGKEMQQYSDELGGFAEYLVIALDGAIKNYEKGLQGESTGESEAKFSLQETEDNITYVNVDVDQNRFEGMDASQMAREAREVIKEQILNSKGRIGVIDGTKIVIDHSTVSHYAGAARKQYKRDGRDVAKFKTSTEMSNLLKASIYDDHKTFEEIQKENPGKHPEAVNGFSYYKTLFKVGDNWFVGYINVDNKKNIREFYDLTRIRRIERGEIASEMKSTAVPKPSYWKMIAYYKNKDNAKFSLAEDNTGRELSEGQQKYFKNSKVVDDKGRLKVLYHGTEAQAFSIFNTPGIWATPDKELSTEYAGEWNNWRNETEGYGNIRYDTNGLEPEVYGDKYLRMYKVYANITNPVTLGELNRTLPDDYAGMEMDNFGIKTEEQFDRLYDLVQEHVGDKIWQLTETKEFIDLMKELGYDGMFASENGHDTVCVFSSSQLKNVNNLNPTSLEDIRYSLGLDDEDVFADNDDRKAVEILKEGMEALKNKAVDVPKLRSLALKLRNEFGSSYNTNKLTEDLEKAFAYMQTEDHVDYKTMMGILKDIARPVIEASNEKVGEEEYKTFVNAMKGYKIRLTDKQKKEVQNAMSYGAYTRAMMPLTITDKGDMTLDQLWEEMVEQSGYALDRDVNEGDMALALLDTLTAMRPAPHNIYGGDIEDVSKDLAMRIIEEYVGGETSRKMQKEIKDYKARLKKDYDERLAKYKGRANADVLARNKKRAEQAKEREAVRKLRHDIKIEAGKLLRWVEKPTEGKSVPHDMMVPVMQFLQAIDFVDPDIRQEQDGRWHTRVFQRVDYENGRKKFIYRDLYGATRDEVLKQFNEAVGRGEGTKDQRSWADKMQGIREIYDKVLKDSDFEDNSMDFLMQTLDAQGLAEDFNDLLSRNKGVADMNHLSSKDLTLINNIIKNIFHAINQGNKAYSSNADIVNLAQSTIKDSEGKEVTNRNGITEGIHKMLRLDNVTPRTFFKLLGKRGHEVYKFLRGGLNQEIMDLRKASDFMENAMTGIDAKKWTGMNATVHEFALSSGSVRMTDAQILGLYFTIRRNGGMDRIKGGIVVDDIKTKSARIKRQNAIHLTDNDIKQIESVLTPEQIAFGQKMQKYMADDCSAMGNETSMKLYGYKKFTDDTYYPWKVDENTVATNNTSENIPMFTGIERSGFTKQLKEGATNPLVIRDIFDVFTDHVAQMAAYHGYAAPVKDTLRWLNYREKSSGDGFDTWTTNKKAINRLTNSDMGVRYITTLLLDINKANKSQYIGNFTDKLIGSYKAAAVGANLRVVAQQPTAYFRALNMVDAKYLLTVNPATAIKNIKKSQEECPISWWKSKGYYETNLGQPIKEIVTGISTTSEKLKDVMMAPAGWADDFTWGFLYTAVENEQRAKYKGQKISAEDFRKAVNDRFDEVIDNTQVVDSTLHRSQYMRSTDRLNKIQTAFMAEPTKSYNMLLEAMLEDRNEGKTMKRTTRAVTAFLLSALATSAAAAVVDAMRKTRDDQDWWDVWLDNLKENMADNMNPFNLLPIVKDVSAALYNQITGESTYGQSGNRFDIEAISSVMNAINVWTRLIEGDSNKSAYGILMANVKPISQITGIPAYNLIKDTVALYNTFMPNIEMTVNNQNAGRTERKKEFISDVDKEKSDEVLDEAILNAVNHGVSIYDLKGAVQSEYKNQYFDAYSEGEMEQAREIADKAARAYARMGLPDDEIDQIINGWQDEVITYSALDKAIANGEGIEDEIKHVQEGKDDDRIVKHILDRFGSTIAYEDTHDTESAWRENVETALKAVDPTMTYDSALKEAEQKAAEKEAQAEQEAKVKGLKNDFFDAVSKKDGSAGRKALDALKAEGKDAKTIKSAVSTQYHEAWKDATTQAEKDKAKNDWKSAYTLVNNYFGTESKDLDKTWADWEAKQ